MKEALADVRAGTDEDEAVDDEATDPGQVLLPQCGGPEPAESCRPPTIRPPTSPGARARPARRPTCPGPRLDPDDVGRGRGPAAPGCWGPGPGGSSFPAAEQPRVAGAALDPYAEPSLPAGGGGRPVPTLQPAPPKRRPGGPSGGGWA